MNSVWGEDCLEFKPQRWISENGGIKREPSYKFLSFNAGPRTCLGKEVAFTQMKAAAAAVVHNFDLQVEEGQKPGPNVSVILYMKEGLNVTVKDRWGNPQVVSKIREELESIIPAESIRKSCLFDIHDLNKLVYLHGALCEALRLYPSVAFQHKSSVVADVLPSGRHVSPKTKILFFMYAVGRMNSIWGEDCLEFKPKAAEAATQTSTYSIQQRVSSSQHQQKLASVFCRKQRKTWAAASKTEHRAVETAARQHPFAEKKS
ncbi:Cytochrome P450 [Melia azedarach]|uniref:Cytochrome P450 n=1 Tax=Melia azedarach TaxID=155640 RepID=A0ACC1XW93_MELAZ|nr:Cytochrome P450 [Melia azedarach]